MSNHFTNIFSRAFGVFAAKRFNPAIQSFINKGYVKLLGLDMSRFKPAQNYKSLKELFIRELEQYPVIDESANNVIAPCDSKVVAIGKIEEHTSHQIKGMSYDTNSLIGALGQSSILDGGDFVNFYLSPKDYHRYHMPFYAKVLSTTYIPGKLYPVNMPLLRKKKNLYIENERVVIEVLDNNNKKHFIVLVGALNVGKMVVTFEENIKTNAKNGYARYEYSEPKELNIGKMFGWFEMGSTVVILSQKDAIEYNLTTDQTVRFGDSIGKLNDN